MKISANKTLNLCLFILLILPSVVHAQVAEGTLVWNTFLGGTNRDEGLSIAVDNSGNVYVSGYSLATWGSPVRGHYGNGDEDAFVAKLDAEGNILWNTFLGGENSDVSFGITVDGSGNVYITGWSGSSWGSPKNNFGDSAEIFVVKLDTNGNMLWNTFLGGTSSDLGFGIYVNGSGSVYLTGKSRNQWGTPVRDHYGNGEYDAFSAMLDEEGNLLWNTFLGGSGEDYGNDVSVDDSGSVHIVGYSYQDWGSPVRPHVWRDAFVAKLDDEGNLLWNTFLGGQSIQDGTGITLDSTGNVYVSGSSTSFILFPWGNPVRTHSGGMDAFSAKLDMDGNLIWNTFLGGSGEDYGYDISIDSRKNLHITGFGDGTWEMPLRQYRGDWDAFSAKLNNNGSLMWNTFLGEVVLDYGYDIGVDPSGNAYVAGRSDAQWGSPLRTHKGGRDGFVAKLARPLFVFNVTAIVDGEGGSVDQIIHKIEEGKDAVINILPDEGYEIHRIIDNGMEVPVSIPYVIREIGEDHNVLISFQKILYPPELNLTGTRKSDNAWILKKEYAELNISINAHPTDQMEILKFVLYKIINGIKIELNSWSSPGSYSFTDKTIKNGVSAAYELIALTPDRKTAATSGVITI